MRSIITQAPIQVRQDTTNRHERLFPLLVAESLARVEEQLFDTPSPRVDMWNCNGLKIDQDYLNSGYAGDRAGYIGSLITQRYVLLEKHYGIEQSPRSVIRDDDPEVEEIVISEVRQLIESGAMSVKDGEFTHCDECDRVIAPLAANIQACRTDASHHLSNTISRGLFLLAPDSVRKWLINEAQVSPKVRQLLRSAVNNLPHEIQASKQRENGISLVEFGIDEEFVLDPLVALSMLKRILQVKGHGQLRKVVLGRDTVKNYVPYSLLTGNSEEVSYIGVGMIPPYNLDDSILDKNLYFPFLPLFMSSRSSDLSEEQLSALHREFIKVQRKYTASKFFLENQSNILQLQEGSYATDDIFADVYCLLKVGDMGGAIQAYRTALFTNLSKGLIPRLKAVGDKPDQRLVNELKELHGIIYG